MPCIPMLEDNQGVLQPAQNPISKSNSKHIKARHHFISTSGKDGNFGYLRNIEVSECRFRDEVFAVGSFQVPPEFRHECALVECSLILFCVSFV